MDGGWAFLQAEQLPTRQRQIVIIRVSLELLTLH